MQFLLVVACLQLATLHLVSLVFFFFSAIFFSCLQKFKVASCSKVQSCKDETFTIYTVESSFSQKQEENDKKKKICCSTGGTRGCSTGGTRGCSPPTGGTGSCSPSNGDFISSRRDTVANRWKGCLFFFFGFAQLEAKVRINLYVYKGW